MGDCDLCAGDDSISYTCNECGGTFCSNHRLPEDHNCVALRNKSSEAWFKDELSTRENRQSKSIRRRDNDSTTDSGDDSPPTCHWCDATTELECPKCGTPYCEDHQDPSDHNCAFLDEDDADQCSVSGCDKGPITTCDTCGKEYCYRHYPEKKHDCKQTSGQPDSSWKPYDTDRRSQTSPSARQRQKVGTGSRSGISSRLRRLGTILVRYWYLAIIPLLLIAVNVLMDFQPSG